MGLSRFNFRSQWPYSRRTFLIFQSRRLIDNSSRSASVNRYRITLSAASGSETVSHRVCSSVSLESDKRVSFIEQQSPRRHSGHSRTSETPLFSFSKRFICCRFPLIVFTPCTTTISNPPGDVGGYLYQANKAR